MVDCSGCRKEVVKDVVSEFTLQKVRFVSSCSVWRRIADAEVAG